MIAAAGPDGFRKIVGMAQSLIDSLWEQMAARFDLRQPGHGPFLRQAVRGYVRGIANNQVRGAYGDEIESRIAAMRAKCAVCQRRLCHRNEAAGRKPVWSPATGPFWRLFSHIRRWFRRISRPCRCLIRGTSHLEIAEKSAD